MSLRTLEQQGLIEPFPAALQDIDDLLDVADRDLGAARHMLSHDAGWGLAITYNAALQTAVALMYAHEYRPRGASMHKTALDFAAAVLAEPLRAQVGRLNRLRRKRHRTLYHMAGLVSQTEAEGSLAFVEQFVIDVKRVIAEKLKE